MNIQTFCEKASEGACLAFCYIRAALGKVIPEKMFGILWDAADKNIIDENDNCYVKDAIALMRLANPNKKYAVMKKDITSLEELDGQLAAVSFKNGGYNHFVLVEKGQIIFDSLDNSLCVKYGKPTTARIIKIEEK